MPIQYLSKSSTSYFRTDSKSYALHLCYISFHSPVKKLRVWEVTYPRLHTPNHCPVTEILFILLVTVQILPFSLWSQQWFLLSLSFWSTSCLWRINLHNLELKPIYFLEQFRFTAKPRRYRHFPYLPFPYTSTVASIINIPHQSGAFFTLDEPPLTHHYHPKSHDGPFLLLYIVQVWTNIQCHVSNITVSYFLKNLCSAYSSIHCYLPSPTLAATDLFTASVLAFPERQKVAIIHYLVSSYWPLSLSNEHLSFPHIFSRMESSF